MERKTPKRVVVSQAAVRRAGARATKASAKLEGRIVPAGHRRSAAATAYLAKQQPPKRSRLHAARLHLDTKNSSPTAGYGSYAVAPLCRTRGLTPALMTDTDTSQELQQHRRYTFGANAAIQAALLATSRHSGDWLAR
jgi:hypothetical protein